MQVRAVPRAARGGADHVARRCSCSSGRRFVRDRGAAARAGHGLRRAGGARALPDGGRVRRLPGRRRSTSTSTRRSSRCASRAPQEVYAAVRHGVGAGAGARRPGWPSAPGAAPVAALGHVRGGARRRRRRRCVISDVAARLRAIARSERRSAGVRARDAARAVRRACREPAPRAGSRDGFFASLPYLGQLDRTYLVCEARGRAGAHRPARRARARRLPAPARGAPAPAAPRRSGCCSRAPSSSTPAQAAAAAEHADGARRRSASSSSRSAATRCALRGGRPPTCREARGRSRTLLELLDELADADGSRAVDRARSITCSPPSPATRWCAPATCCRAARGRARCSRPWTASTSAPHCPHGRPVLLRIGVSEIERRFGR